MDLVGYRDLLLDLGFAEAEMRSITDDVYRPLGKFLSKRLTDPDMRHVNPLIRYSFTPLGFRLAGLYTDYIVAVAYKA